MREIKFRAWNGSFMEYGGFSIHATGGTNPLVGLTNINPDSPVLQYTGLKDKNDKEIYEGDVVMVINYLNGKPWEGHIHPCEVYFNCGKFELKNHWMGETLCNSTVEIIGNIYENPELIK